MFRGFKLPSFAQTNYYSTLNNLPVFASVKKMTHHAPIFGRHINAFFVNSTFVAQTYLFKWPPVSGVHNIINKNHYTKNTDESYPLSLNALRSLPEFDRLSRMIRFKHLISNGHEMREMSALLPDAHKVQLFYFFSNDQFIEMGNTFHSFLHLLESFPAPEQLELIDIFGSKRIGELVYACPHPTLSLSHLLHETDQLFPELKASDQTCEYFFDALFADKECKSYYMNYIIDKKINPIRPVRLSHALNGLPDKKHRVLLEWIGPENLYTIIHGRETGPYPSANLGYICEHLSEKNRAFVKDTVHTYAKQLGITNLSYTNKQTFFSRSISEELNSKKKIGKVPTLSFGKFR